MLKKILVLPVSCTLLLLQIEAKPQRTTQLPSHSFPLPTGMGRRIRRKKRQKLMGWDENSITEWQREKKTTTNNTEKTLCRTCSVLTSRCSACF